MDVKCCYLYKKDGDEWFPIAVVVVVVVVAARFVGNRSVLQFLPLYQFEECWDS